MKKISCIGYHATGSGAVDDFLREFNNVQCADYGIESRFLQDPDGISDLEYNLIENPHRLNSGFALKRYLIFAKKEERSYRHIFGKEWMKISKEYIENLSQFSYKGYWHADIRIISFPRLFIYKARRLLNKLLPPKFRKTKYYNYFPNIETYCVNINKEEFLKITQQYCEKLSSILNKKNKEYVVLDQVASPQNIERYLRYIKDLKVIIVDRDPRDVYLSDVIKNRDYVLPKDVKNFCEVYKMSRKKVDTPDSENVLRINFEDMIYKYESTTKKIMNFLGLKEQNHVEKKVFFNPNVSKKNSQMWKNKKEYAREIQYIEQELKEYLYVLKGIDEK